MSYFDVIYKKKTKMEKVYNLCTFSSTIVFFITIGHASASPSTLWKLMKLRSRNDNSQRAGKCKLSFESARTHRNIYYIQQILLSMIRDDANE